MHPRVPLSLSHTHTHTHDSLTPDPLAFGGDFTLTCNKEGNSYCNNDNVPQAPKVRCVEKGSSIPELAEFITRESSDPYIE